MLARRGASALSALSPLSPLSARTVPTSPAPRAALGWRRSLFITTEDTPNPATIKFKPGQRVVESESGFDFRSPQAAKSSPLARELLRVDGVTGVFLGPDFVTVTKADDPTVRWAHIKPMVFSALMEHFAKGEPAVLEGAAAAGADGDAGAGSAPAKAREYTEDEAEIVEMIKELLEQKVRPMARDDGGDVLFRDFDPKSGIVHVQLVGSCVGCPSSTVTLKNGVENMLRHYIPEVKSVEAETVAADVASGHVDDHHLSFKPASE